AEPPHEFLGIPLLGETVDVEPFVLVEDCVIARARRQIFAECADRLVVAARASTRRQRHLMRPIAIDHRGRQLPLALHHAGWDCGKSSGTCPKAFRITAPSNSPRSRSPLQENATAPVSARLNAMA